MLKQIGKYEILRQLGTGSMGTVYQAKDRNIGRTVAIKTIKLPESDREKAEMAKRFKQEAQAAGNLSHPNIVIIFEYDEVGDTAFIVMEYVSGVELKTCFDNREAFSQERIVTIMKQLLSALDYSHRNGVIHRDIKPSNIMITAEGQVRVTDFGIARLESSELTQVGIALGTPSYMSPEQCMGQPVTGRSDIFSAGVLLYQLLTGEKPFAGPSITSILHKITQLEPPAPSQLNYTVTPAFDAIVKKALAKRPAERFSSAADFAAALSQIDLASAPSGLPPQPDEQEATTAIPLEDGVALQAGGTPAAEGTVAVPLGDALQQSAGDHATVVVPLSEVRSHTASPGNGEASSVAPITEEATVAVPLSEAPLEETGAGEVKHRSRLPFYGLGIGLLLIIGTVLGWQLLADRNTPPAPAVSPATAPPELSGSPTAEGSSTAITAPASPPVAPQAEPPDLNAIADPEVPPRDTVTLPGPAPEKIRRPPAAAPTPGSVTMEEPLEEPPQREQVEQPSPPPAANRLVIATTPPGASVDHQTLGRLGTADPLQTDLEPGLHQLYITKQGFQDISLLLEIPEKGTQQLQLTLQPEP